MKKTILMLLLGMLLLCGCTRSHDMPALPVRPDPLPSANSKHDTGDDLLGSVRKNIENIQSFFSQTQMHVDMTGLALLFGGFTIDLEKKMTHEEDPLDTQVDIRICVPSVQGEEVSHTSVYTDRGNVFVYNERKGRYEKSSGLRPEEVRKEYDYETMVQQRLLSQSDANYSILGDELWVNYTPERTEAREILEEMFRDNQINIPGKVDRLGKIESLEVKGVYDIRHLLPKSLEIKGILSYFGLKLNIAVDVQYHEVNGISWEDMYIQALME